MYKSYKAKSSMGCGSSKSGELPRKDLGSGQSSHDSQSRSTRSTASTDSALTNDDDGIVAPFEEEPTVAEKVVEEQCVQKTETLPVSNLNFCF